MTSLHDHDVSSIQQQEVKHQADVTQYQLAHLVSPTFISDDESSSDADDSREFYQQHLQQYIYDSSHESMPSLFTDSEDDDDDYWNQIVITNQSNLNNNNNNSDNNNKDNKNDINVNLIVNDNSENIFKYNNIHFVYDQQQPTVYIGETAYYPPELDESITAGACNENDNKYTNVKCVNGIITEKNLKYNNDKIVIIQNSCDESDPCILFSYCQTLIRNGNCILTTINNIEYDNSQVEDIYFGRDVEVVRSKNTQWYLHVPIAFENGNVAKTRVFADPGANTPCIDTDYAQEHFPNMISKINAAKQIYVPGGWIKPKYCLWMSFPTKKGSILKSKFLLVNNLPVKILLDINILQAFGYQFKEETPEIFRHSEVDEGDLELRNFGEHLTNYNVNRIENHNWFNCAIKAKIHQVKNVDMFGNDDNRVTLYDSVKGDGELLYPQTEIIVASEEEKDKLNLVLNGPPIDDTPPTTTINDVISINLIQDNYPELEVIDPETIDLKYLTEINPTIEQCKNIVNNLNAQEYVEKKLENDKQQQQNNSNSSSNNGIKSMFKKIMMLLPKMSFLSDEKEDQEAYKIFVNEKLTFPNYDYLKRYEKKYGKRYHGLYEAVMDWIKRYDHIFAKRTFDRRTIKTEPAKLGLAPEHRNKIIFAPQYPLSPLQRLHLINWTRQNQFNGFWYSVKRSQHCIPILMIPKRTPEGRIYRYRPAFDARILNSHCILMNCLMPTFLDFRNLHQQRGPTTMADLKNYFDCIPLWEKDQPFCTSMTPWGFYRMKHMTYGHKNAAPEAQKRANELAMAVQNALIYIDDLQIKHLFDDGTKEIIESLERLGKYCEEKYFLLNPKKFFPCCDEADGFGFKNTMIGEMISDSYRKKMLAVAKPTTKEEIKSLIGLIGYVNHHLWNVKSITYWLTTLEETTQANTKHKRLVWTKEANLAFTQLRWLMADTANRMLYHPTRDGRFALKCDACSYGIGGELYQWQYSTEDNQEKWRMVDMWSKVMPKPLRHSHSMVQEGFALVACMEHWQFFLLRKEFDFSTDNIAIATVLGNGYKQLASTSQKQLLRFITRTNAYRYVARHIEGLKNPIADALSRFTLKLIKIDQTKPPEEQEYPPIAMKPIVSSDSNTPILDDEEKKYFEIAKSEGQRLEAKRKELIKQSKFHAVNVVSYGYNCDPNEIKISERDDRNSVSKDKEKYKFYQETINKSFNNTMRDYIDNCNYLERNKLREFIYSNCVSMCSSTDDTMGACESRNLKDEFMVMLSTLNNINNDTCKQLQHELEQEQWTQLVELSLIRDQVYDNEIICVVDERYDYHDDLTSDEDIDLEQPQRPQTRSQTRKKQQQQRQLRQDDDEIDDSEYFSKLNYQFNDIRNYMISHEDFMKQIFGHRDDAKVLDLTKYRQFQESDHLLKIVIRNFKLADKDHSKWIKEDIDHLVNWNYDLYDHLCNDDFVIEDKLLKVKITNEDDGSTDLKIVVPFFMIGKIMDYAHHNMLNHHWSKRYTRNKIEKVFWWAGMQSDIAWFIKNCISCQYVKGSMRHRAPLVDRDPPERLEHLFADLLGPIYGNYYILVLVDYATGFCMLIPLEGADGLTIAHAILNHWFKIFGYFRIFESDWGSGFNNILMEYLTDILGSPHEIAEPRSHRSIGKVERVIGFVQQMLNHYNLLLNNQLTDEIDKEEEAWTRIQVIIPLLQLALNQRKTRITGVSPNMAIFGMNVHDGIDIAKMNLVVNRMKKNKNLNRSEYEFVIQLSETIERIAKISKTNWEEVTYLSKEFYNKKYNINESSVKRMKKKYKVGTQVLYYIGDKRVAKGKWRQKWTGPWIVDKHIGDSSLIIGDPTTGNQKRVSFDRLKQFNKIDFIAYKDLIDFDQDYQNYQNELLKRLSKYNVKYRNQKLELDYTKRRLLSKQKLRTGRRLRRKKKEHDNENDS